MKKTIILFLLSMAVFAQEVIKVELNGFEREIPPIGFNTNTIHTKGAWTYQSFRDSAAKLNSAVLRYPGGTTANYWDWKTGWFLEGITLPDAYKNVSERQTYTIDDLKLGLGATKAEALFVLNILTSTIDYQLEGLKYAESIGIPVKYVEIGNEHNLAADQIPPGEYAGKCKIWADSIKKYFPESKICLVGGNPPSLPAWHDSIFADNPKINALAFHVYLDAGDSDGIFDVRRALSVPFQKLNQRYLQAGFNAVADSIEVWTTEYNMWEAGFGAQPIIAQTWTHAFYVAVMNHLFLENPKIKMIINNNITNTDFYMAVDPHDNHITANGIAMKLLLDASRGKSTAKELSFIPEKRTNYSGVSFSNLLGWKFYGDSDTTIFIVNISSSKHLLEFPGSGNVNFSFKQFYADSSLKVNGLSSLNNVSGAGTDTLSVPPFSFSLIYTEVKTTSAGYDNALPDKFELYQNYPNPFNPSAVIKYSIPNVETLHATSLRRHVLLKVYDILGREVETLINEYKSPGNYAVEFSGTKLPSGIYFYRLTSGGNSITKKMILLK